MQPSAPTACLDENVVLAFLAGRLSGQSRVTIEKHLATCGSCVALVALAARTTIDASALALDAPCTPAPTRARGSAIGRYTILDLVGHGGMGDVYAAYDPELDRRVALKLLHEDGRRQTSPGEARARLLREAKALAKLSHPNVIVVHDAGTVDGRVFIAMEFVRGRTLSDWLAAQPRTWPAIRDVFVAAGRGLAAAHAAGLVHRDVKPQNIMVGDDGAVRVTDFGLASDVVSPVEGPVGAPGGDDDLLHSQTHPLTLTRSGVWLGTPLFMAPEQFRGQKADERSDQFSFCVALYNAVYGERPFAGESLTALRDAVVAGQLREPPKKTVAPAWLRKIIARGLSVRPDDRFPSMEALLAALTRDPTRQRRRVVLGVSVAAALLVAGAVAQRSISHPAVLCTGNAEKLRAIWELPDDRGPHPRRQAAEQAFLASGKSFAAVSWEKAAKLVDDYARRWIAMSKENCAATYVSGEQSPQVLDLRTDCLDSALGGVQAVADLFMHADGEIVSGSVTAASGLPDLGRCADTRLLRALVKPPSDPAQRARVETLDRRVSALRALTEGGKPNQATPALLVLVDEATNLGYPPLTAEAFSVLGLAQAMSDGYRGSNLSLWRAMPAAIAGHDDPKAAEIAAMLAGETDAFARSPDEVAAWEAISEAFASRAGTGADRARGWLAQSRSFNAERHDRFKEAAEWARQAIVFKSKVSSEGSLDVAESLDSLAGALLGAGDLTEAMAASAKAESILQRVAGPDALLRGEIMSNRGEILNAIGQPLEGLRASQESLRIFAGILPADKAWNAFPLTGMGYALLALSRSKEALDPLERALKIREKAEAGPREMAQTRFALAQALWQSGGSRPRAVSLARVARADYVRQGSEAAKVSERQIVSWLASHTTATRSPRANPQ
ncbi:MAG TPA: serine/threonine-protein kinase [Polyangia bacterium]|jgi:tetratricopeptide (TPR) repeat protein